jgi:hypothetical protein
MFWGPREIFLRGFHFSCRFVCLAVAVAVVMAIVAATATGLWLHGSGCLEVAAWLWLLGWIMHADILESPPKKNIRTWLVIRPHGCGCLALLAVAAWLGLGGFGFAIVVSLALLSLRRPTPTSSMESRVICFLLGFFVM